MKKSLKSQRGLTMISIVLILGLIAFFTLLVLKIGPIYLNHSKVLSAMEALEQTTDIKHKSKHEVLSNLKKRFNMNYVEHVEDNDIKITKRPNYLMVEIEYERVEQLAGNLSVLVEFYEVFEEGSDE